MCPHVPAFSFLCVGLSDYKPLCIWALPPLRLFTYMPLRLRDCAFSAVSASLPLYPSTPLHYRTLATLCLCVSVLLFSSVIVPQYLPSLKPQWFCTSASTRHRVNAPKRPCTIHILRLSLQNTCASVPSYFSKSAFLSLVSFTRLHLPACSSTQLRELLRLCSYASYGLLRPRKLLFCSFAAMHLRTSVRSRLCV